MNWAVIMAGGYGERFWPMSRRKQPKQLLPIIGRRSMIQDTVTRLRPLFKPSQMMVVTNQEQAPLVRKQLPQVKHIIAEPMGRNTAPCIGLAAAIIAKHDPEGVMCVLPADHVIPKPTKYLAVLREVLKIASEKNVLVTIGIKPTTPHTGYGYINVGKPLSGHTSIYRTLFWSAKQFIEKPNLVKAKKFLSSGHYRWNAGMFAWSIKSIQQALAEHQPRIAEGCQRIQKTVGKKTFTATLKREYAKMEKISIDYAIMEKANNVIVANGNFEWDDVGDWPAVGRHIPSDQEGNSVRGEFVGIDAKNCVVLGKNRHVVTAVGVSDLVIVHTPDATLVCHKSEAQKVRDLVKKIGNNSSYRSLL